MSRCSGHKKDSKRYYDWMYHAYQDLMAARFLIQDGDLYEPTVFHCQQAVEKSLKSFMLYKAHRLFDGHNITWLCKQAAMLDCGFTPFIEKTVELNKFYIEARYPADIPTIIDEETAQALLNCAESIAGIVCGAVKFDYNSYHKRRVRSS
ncbi:MAG: HEPN domain-containing protein [Oscillospiraceae bacterium]|nr:HEPN domain-containing protein [Oscillospiraceae bacterium]